MNITNAKITKKFTETIFQTATSSGLLNSLHIHVDENIVSKLEDLSFKQNAIFNNCKGQDMIYTCYMYVGFSVWEYP